MLGILKKIFRKTKGLFTFNQRKISTNSTDLKSTICDLVDDMLSEIKRIEDSKYYVLPAKYVYRLDQLSTELKNKKEN
jgi:hypothetical protein